MLDALCRDDSPLARLQILERTVPDSGNALHRDLAAHGDPHAPAAARAAYEQVIAAPSAFAQRHEAYLAVTLDPRRGSARERIASHGGGDQGAAATLFQLLAQIGAGLADAGVEVDGWLPPRGLAAVLRSAFDPQSTAAVDRRGGGPGDDPGGDTGLPSGVDPRAVVMYGQPAFDHYRTDSAYHRTYWVLEWPRVEVPAAFLQPLLLNSRYRRAVSLVMEPVTARRAVRDIDIADSHLAGERRWRAKIGRRERHRDTVEATANARRERELVAGYGTYRLTGLVAVTAGTLPELDLACGDVLSLAAQSRLECAPLVHQQDQAFFAAALPLARSLT
jgi:Putative type VII ESX secretion system translocon, EccE